MSTLQFVPLAEIERIRSGIANPHRRAATLADAARLNTLTMIMAAGSGHIGSSFSAMDIVTWLWAEAMAHPNEPDVSPSDTYFSSKGHDAPGLYATLIALGRLPFESLFALRRLGGLPGHPDMGTPGMVTNTGPLGMGISKAMGLALARRLQGKSGRIYVLTGDGELQEGQFWESLQPAANRGLAEITAIVDHNKIQSDTHVHETSDLGDLEAKFRAFGWAVRRLDGHDMRAIAEGIRWAKAVTDRPQALIADTVKGRGVSFMEGMGEDGFYHFHSGAPSAAHYAAAETELAGRVNRALAAEGLAPLALESRPLPARGAPQAPQRLVAAYGDELVRIARERSDLVALDADLLFDTGLIPFKQSFPDRFVECGIAEQHMVSVAGGLALRGLLPVVHSFACFLTTRPNEQIYNNATEQKKIIYVGSLAGLLPAMPGHSHQSVRDIAAVGAIPGLTLFEPANEAEARLAIRWAVEENPASTYLRLVSIPLSLPYALPAGYALRLGQGVFLRKGKDVALVSYGPVMLKEAWRAAEALAGSGISAAVINLPWLNRMDARWLLSALGSFRAIVSIDDHYAEIGQGSLIAAAFAESRASHPTLVRLGVREIPVCGSHDEALRHHKLDGDSIAEAAQAALA